MIALMKNLTGVLIIL